jgi:V/A-type H+-transporting ATPase subunit E
MALDDILRKIKADAQAEADAILSAAHAERERVLQEAGRRAQAAAQRIEATGRTRADEAKRKDLATANVEVRRIVLEAKRQVLNEVFERALDRLGDLPDGEYRELLAGLAAQGALSGSEQIVVSQRDRERLGDGFPAMVNQLLQARGLPGNLSYSQRTRALRGGLVLSAGDIEMNMSFERTLASLRESLEPEVATTLFSEGSAGVAR